MMRSRLTRLVISTTLTIFFVLEKLLKNDEEDENFNDEFPLLVLLLTH